MSHFGICLFALCCTSLSFHDECLMGRRIAIVVLVVLLLLLLLLKDVDLVAEPMNPNRSKSNIITVGALSQASSRPNTTLSGCSCRQLLGEPPRIPAPNGRSPRIVKLKFKYAPRSSTWPTGSGAAWGQSSGLGVAGGCWPDG